MRSRKDLDSKAGEKPRSVRRNIRRLVSPIVKLVVSEETDIRHEDTGIGVDSVEGIEMISTVCFGEIAVRVIQIPLPARRASVVPGRSLGIQSKLRHDSRANIV